ncbi:MAG: ABC transporter ATP-binding protein [Candidatus Rokuibacteriota bacterium]
MSRVTVLALRGVRKTFPGVIANDGIDLEVRDGEVHALLGENGAGKTTLMNILAGLYQPDAGMILLDGHPVRLSSPRDAYRHGIGMVHQSFKLVPSLTVIENTLLGLESAAGGAADAPPRAVAWRLDIENHRAPIAHTAARFNLSVDVDAPVWHLSVGEQQRVEIIRMLYRGVRIVIVDEPTAALTPSEAGGLLTTLRRMAQDGCSVIFVSHKLDEVMAVADRVSVIRHGRTVTTVPVGETNRRQLAALMMGEADDKARVAVHVGPRGRGPTVLSCEDLSVGGDHGRRAVHGLTLTVSAGEVVGIAGVAGNGQRELAEALVGLRPISGGTIRLEGRDVTRASVFARIQAGLRYLPADRLRVGAAPNLSVAENLVLKRFREPAFGSWMWQDRRAVGEHALRLMRTFTVTGGEPHTPVRLLSGGNLQKMLLARELTLTGSMIVAESPSRGLDIGATRFAHALLEEEAALGRGVLLVSEDADELLLLCDRIAVMSSGRLIGMLSRDTASRERLGLLMAGVPDA